MPQERILLQRTPTFQVERVVLHAVHTGWSPSYEPATRRLLLPASGASEFLLGGQAVLLDGMTALCLPAGQPYQMKPCTASVRASIVVSEQHGGAHSVLPPPDAWVLTPHALWRLRRHWRAVARGRAPAATDSTQALLSAVLQSAVRVSSRQGRSQACVQRAQRYMAARVAAGEAAALTLYGVADAACCSPFHLARMFRRHTGTSVHAYRQALRLAMALQRLDEGEGDLAALAHELGYSSQSHLGAAFKAALGVTPAQVRREFAD